MAFDKVRGSVIKKVAGKSVCMPQFCHNRRAKEAKVNYVELLVPAHYSQVRVGNGWARQRLFCGNLRKPLPV